MALGASLGPGETGICLDPCRYVLAHGVTLTHPGPGPVPDAEPGAHRDPGPVPVGDPVLWLRGRSPGRVPVPIKPPSQGLPYLARPRRNASTACVPLVVTFGGGLDRCQLPAILSLVRLVSYPIESGTVVSRS